MNALDPIRARLAAATPGPWANYGNLGHEVYAVNAHEDDEPGYVAEAIPRKSDAEFIAHAPTDMARLLAVVEAVEKLIESPFAAADKRHYDDDFNRGHVAGYNAAARLLRQAIDKALGGAE